MITKNIKVINKLGVHARPAGLIVELTSKAASDVSIRYGDTLANAKSILNVMMLAVEPGAEIEVVVDGEDEVQIMEELEKLFADKFYEDE